MDTSSQRPKFERLHCSSRNQFERPFTPFAHDLIILNRNGKPEIARNASAAQMINVLCCSKEISAGLSGGDGEDAPSLTLIRFEEEAEDETADASPQGSDNDWSTLWPVFDSCCNKHDNAMDFVSRIRQADSQCYSKFSKTTKSHDSRTIKCRKVSYSINFLEKHISLAHHSHRINGEVKEMVRVVTHGLPLERVQALIHKAMLFSKTELLAPVDGSVDKSTCSVRVPHPKAIICGLLECLEEWCRKQLTIYRTLIGEIESDINEQRDPDTSKPKGLEINYIKLSETIINLGETGQKLQHLQSSIASLEESTGIPDMNGDENIETAEYRIYRQWTQQLDKVTLRLRGLKCNSQQHTFLLKGLQTRVKGILNIVAILRADQDQEWARKSDERRRQEAARREKTAEYQSNMLQHQIDMLRQQELIASRTKRDNSVVKVIALMTAIFLPGTFIAAVFSMPVFHWDNEHPMGPHFRTYWYFTGPITGFVVLGFSLWFVKMRIDEEREEKLRDEASGRLRGSSILSGVEKSV